DFEHDVGGQTPFETASKSGLCKGARHVKRIGLALVCLHLVNAVAFCQQTKKLSLHPAAAPVPALQYRLLPDPFSLKSGNACVDYYRAFSPQAISMWRSDDLIQKVVRWRNMPLQDLPRSEIEDTAKWVLRQLDEGARRQDCNWQMDAATRKEGMNLLLPDLQAYGTLTIFLEARARAEMAAGDFKQAAYTLQTGLAFCRHLSEYPTL